MPSFGASDALKIIKKEFEMRKLLPPAPPPTHIKGVKNSEKQTTVHYKASSRTLNFFWYVDLLLLEYKDNL